MVALKNIQKLYLAGNRTEAYHQLSVLKDEQIIHSFEYNLLAAFLLFDLSKHKQAFLYFEHCIHELQLEQDVELIVHLNLKKAITLYALGYSKEAKYLLMELSGVKQKEIKQFASFYLSIFNGGVLKQNQLELISDEFKQNNNSLWKNFSELNLLIHQVYSGQITELPNMPENAPPFYQCIYSALKLLMNRQEKDKLLFIHRLSKLEGIVYYRDTVRQAINQLLASNQLTDTEEEFLTRWKQGYLSSKEIQDESRLVGCNFKACESRCCYDGAYLEDGEEEMIQHIVLNHQAEFSHLPENFIVDGTWNDLCGRKTNTRPHQYKSPDYPAHFNQTRCVFANEEGACSLQLFAIQRGESPWKYKPKACSLHPLQTMKFGNFFAPPTLIEEDSYNLGLSYPGYVSYTPCGTHRADGEHWKIALNKETQIAQEQ